MKILVTGGCGYIGSHAALELALEGHEVVVVDDLSNSSKEVLASITKISERSIIFYHGCITDQSFLGEIFYVHNFDAVLHFAGLKSVAESQELPDHYYNVNVGGTICLIKVMAQHKVKRLIFSSSATVYGSIGRPPYVETDELQAPVNPYGFSKYCVERLLTNLCQNDKEWCVDILRYFNPVGAHVSGLIGEHPTGRTSNLMPTVIKSLLSGSGPVKIFGDDYNTPDGTCLRDYIHIDDLIKGHLAAFKADLGTGARIFNLGTGVPVSVLELIHEFENCNGVTIPKQISSRRKGDVDKVWADVTKAEKILGWKAKKSLADMVVDSWRFAQSR